jgi:hypothetical protein
VQRLTQLRHCETVAMVTDGVEARRLRNLI